LHAVFAMGCIGGQPDELEPPDPPDPVLEPPDPAEPVALPPAPDPPAPDPLAPALPVVDVFLPELSSPPQFAAPAMTKRTNDPTIALRAFRIGILPAEGKCASTIPRKRPLIRPFGRMRG
jgi:hypothetical protein